MSVNKYEAVGIAISVGAMVLVLWLMRLEETAKVLSQATDSNTQVAAIVVGGGENQNAALAEAITEGSTASGKIEKLIIDDIVFGEGAEVVAGDVVKVHYIGSLQNGQQFDNSYLRGEPFSFTLGAGKVIPGWERGLLGMKVGGQRVLVIPADLAYGKSGAGPIPGGATLVFAIELLSIEK